MNLIDRIKELKQPLTIKDSQYERNLARAVNKKIDEVIAMLEIQALSVALTDEQLDKLKAIKEASGILKELTPEELAIFKEAIKRV